MRKSLSFALLILSGAALATAAALAGSSNANQSSGKAVSNSCPPVKWTALDLNHDGYANRDEVAKAAPCINFDKVDSNGDGDLSRVEFLNFKEAKAKGQSSNSSENSQGNNTNQSSGKCPPDSWTALDLNHDGYANKDEVAKAAPCINFDKVDSNGDGDLSRVEFLDFKQGKSNKATAGNSQEASKSKAGQKQAKNQKSQKSGGSGGNVDQSQYKTPKALVMNVPKGQLKNPFDPHNTAIAKKGHQLFLNHGCSGCHGGGGGGGMCPPLTDSIWSYGDDPDTLYRLITVGSKQMQAEFGYSRNMMQTMKANMPPLGPSFDHHPKDVWKVITWIESKHLKN